MNSVSLLPSATEVICGTGRRLDLIVSQSLRDVCAVAADEVPAHALHRLVHEPALTGDRAGQAA